MNKTDEILTKPRTNGFQRPFNPYQVSTWIIFGSDIIVFFLILIPGLPYAGKIILSIFYIIVASTVFYIGFKCTGMDPTDSVVYSERDAKKNKNSTDTFQKYRLFCTICGTHVQEKSKHCGTCNRCAEGFDHHCVWLNNCIGRKNYKLFLKLISTTFLFILLRFSVTIYLILECNNQPQNVPINEFYQNLGIETYWILLIITIIKDPLLLFLLINLILFHLWLTYKKQSTYDFIIQRRKKNKEKKLSSNAGGTGKKKNQKLRPNNSKNTKINQSETEFGLKDSRGDTELQFTIEKPARNVSMIHLKESVNDVKRHQCDEEVNEEGEEEEDEEEEEEEDIENGIGNPSEVDIEEKYNNTSKDETVGIDAGSKSLEGHDMIAKANHNKNLIIKQLAKNTFLNTGSQQNIDDETGTTDQWNGGKQSTINLESFQQGNENFSCKDNPVLQPKSTKIDQTALPKIGSDGDDDNIKGIIEFEDEDVKPEHLNKEEEIKNRDFSMTGKKSSVVKSKKHGSSLTSRGEHHQASASRIESMADGGSLLHMTNAQLRYAIPNPHRYLQAVYSNNHEEERESESEEGSSKASRSVLDVSNNCKSLLIMHKFNNESAILSNVFHSPKVKSHLAQTDRRKNSWEI